MLPREELVGLMIFLAICFIIVIIAIYTIYKDKKKIEEKKEDLLNTYREWCETDHIVLNKCNIKGKDDDSKKEVKDKTEALKPRKRNSKYNKDNTLYIAYDFNILGNKSFAEVDKIIRDMIYGYRSGTVAIKTTSVLFFDAQYKTVFRDIVLINKKGESISLSNLISNPKYYISDVDDLYNFQKVIDGNNILASKPEHLLPLIRKNKIKFKKEKEI